MAEDKGKPPGPQLIPRALRDLKRSPIWRQQQEAIAKLREGLPQPYTPVQREQLLTSQLPADPVVDALAEQARAEAKQELEPEQVPAQVKPEQVSEQIEFEYVDWAEVVLRQIKPEPEEWITECCYWCPDKLSDGGVNVAEKPDWIIEFLQWYPIAEPLPEQEEAEQDGDSEQATAKKRPGGRPPIPLELVQAAQAEYRRALNSDQYLGNEEAAAAHLKAWFEKSSWPRKAKLPSASSFKRHVVRPVLQGD